MNPEVALNTGLLTRMKPFNGRGSSWSGALGVWEKSNIFVAFPFYDFGHNLEPPWSPILHIGVLVNRAHCLPRIRAFKELFDTLFTNRCLKQVQNAGRRSNSEFYMS